MNNQFYHSNLNGCGQYYQSYRSYSHQGCCHNTNSQTSCCQQSRPVTPCCPNNNDDCNPATITIGTTTTLPAGSNATVTNSGGLGKLFTRDIIGIFRHIFGTSSQKEPVFLIHIYIGW